MFEEQSADVKIKTKLEVGLTEDWETSVVGTKLSFWFEGGFHFSWRFYQCHLTTSIYIQLYCKQSFVAVFSYRQSVTAVESAETKVFL
jgi:hypothetical protein